MAELVGGGRGASKPRPGLPAPRVAGGRPRMLYVLCAVEALWAFSFFTVQTTLTLFMTSGQMGASGVTPWGVAAAHLLGRPLSAMALAALAYGLFSAAAYALPLPGGLIGDRAFGGRGRRGVLAVGLAVFTTGLALLAVRGGFVPGLVGVALGTGLIKGNLVAQIGSACAAEGVSRARGFGMYLIAANVGSMAAPLLCGTVGETVGWRPAYAMAALAGALALLTYASAWPRLGFRPAESRPAHAARERGRWIGLLAPLIAEVLFFGAYNQAFSLFPVWARRHVDRRVGGFETPVSWFSTLDGVFTIAATLLAMRLWRRGMGGSPAWRVALGAGLAASAFLILAAVGDGRVGLPAAILFFLLLDAAIPWVDATALARLSAAAPQGWEGGAGGLYFLSAAAASLLTGLLGALYRPGDLSGFWGVHGLAAGATAVAALGFRGARASGETRRDRASTVVRPRGRG